MHIVDIQELPVDPRDQTTATGFHPLLGVYIVANSSGQIQILSSNKHDVLYELERDGSVVTVISCNPLFHIVAFGWNDGTITLWSEEEEFCAEVPATSEESEGVYAAEVTALSWAEHGTLLISGCSDGLTAAWKLVLNESFIDLDKLGEFQRRGSVTHITLRSEPSGIWGPAPRGRPIGSDSFMRESDDPFASEILEFLVAYSTGSIVRCSNSEAFRPSVVKSLEAPLVSVNYFPALDKVLAITETGSISLLRFESDEVGAKLVEETQAKLDISSKSARQKLVSAQLWQDSVAIAGDGDGVRIWSADKLSSEILRVPGGSTITALAFCPMTGILFGANRSFGYFWRLLQPLSPDTPFSAVAAQQWRFDGSVQLEDIPSLESAIAVTTPDISEHFKSSRFMWSHMSNASGAENALFSIQLMPPVASLSLQNGMYHGSAAAGGSRVPGKAADRFSSRSDTLSLDVRTQLKARDTSSITAVGHAGSVVLQTGRYQVACYKELSQVSSAFPLEDTSISFPEEKPKDEPLVLTSNLPYQVRGLSHLKNLFLVHDGTHIAIYDTAEGSIVKVSSFRWHRTIMNAMLVDSWVLIVDRDGIHRASVSGSRLERLRFPTNSPLLAIAVNQHNKIVAASFENGDIFRYSFARKRYKELDEGPVVNVEKALRIEGAVSKLVSVAHSGAVFFAVSVLKPDSTFMYPTGILGVTDGTYMAQVSTEPYFPLGVYAAQYSRDVFSVMLQAPRTLLETSSSFDVPARKISIFFRVGTTIAEHGSFRLADESRFVLSSFEPPAGVGALMRDMDEPIPVFVTVPSFMPDAELHPAVQDSESVSALVTFASSLAEGDVEGAYASILKSGGSPVVWKSLVRACIAQKRADLIESCVSHLKSPEFGLLLRSFDNPLATSSLLFGKISDATHALNDRPSELSSLFREAGLFDIAASVAGIPPPLGANPAFHAQGMHFLALNKPQAAQEALKEAGELCSDSTVAAFNLFGHGDVIRQHTESNPEMSKWAAQEAEAHEDYARAQTLYEAAHDYASVVRVIFMTKGIESARKYAHVSHSKAALLEYARLLESDEMFEDAAKELAAAGFLSHAFRIARNNNLGDLIYRFAMDPKLDKAALLSAASFFSQHPDKIDVALNLYRRAGELTTAALVCLESGLIAPLAQIVKDLEAGDCDPALLSRIAARLSETEDHALAAVHAFAKAGEYERALNLCVEAKCEIDAKLAQSLTPPRPEGASREALMARAKHLQLLGLTLAKQKKFKLAAKMFMQGGNKVRAAQALIRSGDTKAVIAFASVSGSSEVYIAAANYFQTLDWRSDANLLRRITQFYAKARSVEHLVRFFSTCAAQEIEEFRDYSKAQDAITEALRWSAKLRGPDAAAAAADLQTKKQMIAEFLTLRDVARTNPDKLVPAARDFAARISVGDIVQVGDVFALLSEFHFYRGELDLVRQVLGEMSAQGIDLAWFVDQEILDKVPQQTTVPEDDFGEVEDMELSD
eukprot:gnl/Chilomastix_cuspidata/1527.p1 GENE.gnl/Chilomastix_cuspidata/1527~~gnl/Chilomastix_cuspidata/1527.p1  ORF type:complete len:1505 (+),score=643.65 gnl/Chilomastix_cuspidata/1527:46-4515(+)